MRTSLFLAAALLTGVLCALPDDATPSDAWEEVSSFVDGSTTTESDPSFDVDHEAVMTEYKDAFVAYAKQHWDPDSTVNDDADDAANDKSSPPSSGFFDLMSIDDFAEPKKSAGEAAADAPDPPKTVPHPPPKEEKPESEQHTKNKDAPTRAQVCYEGKVCMYEVMQDLEGAQSDDGESDSALKKSKSKNKLGKTNAVKPGGIKFLLRIEPHQELNGAMSWLVQGRQLTVQGDSLCPMTHVDHG